MDDAHQSMICATFSAFSRGVRGYAKIEKYCEASEHIAIIVYPYRRCTRRLVGGRSIVAAAAAAAAATAVAVAGSSCCASSLCLLLCLTQKWSVLRNKKYKPPSLCFPANALIPFSGCCCPFGCSFVSPTRITLRERKRPVSESEL